MQKPEILPERLKEIFTRLNPNWDLWDIGCDHGLLGFEALRVGTCKDLYFVDKVPTIITSLEEKFQTHSAQAEGGNTSRATFLCKDAQDLIANKMQGNIVFSGMGSQRILKIFQKLQLKGTPERKLFIAANANAEGLENLKSYLGELNWVAKEEVGFRDRKYERSLFVMITK